MSGPVACKRPVVCKDAPAWSVEFFVWLEESLKEKFGGDLPKDAELKLFLSGVTVSVAGEQIAINRLAPKMSREELLSIVTAFIVAYSKHVQYKRPARVPVTAELRARMMEDTRRIVEICRKAGLLVEHTGTCGKAYKGHLVIVQFYAGILFTDIGLGSLEHMVKMLDYHMDRNDPYSRMFHVFKKFQDARGKEKCIEYLRANKERILDTLKTGREDIIRAYDYITENIGSDKFDGEEVKRLFHDYRY